MNFVKDIRHGSVSMLVILLAGFIPLFNGTTRAQTETPNTNNTAMNIKGSITVGSETFIITYRDNPTVQSLIEQMPFTVELEDYAGLEKIFYPDPALSIKNAPDGAEPEKGDVMYYAPWGDVAIFYKDFKYAEGLIPMGHIPNISAFVEALNSTNSASFEIETDN